MALIDASLEREEEEPSSYGQKERCGVLCGLEGGDSLPASQHTPRRIGRNAVMLIAVYPFSISCFG
jgi:hypothetical protein